MNPLFVGIDVSSKNNVVCLMKPDGGKHSSFSVQNNLGGAKILSEKIVSALETMQLSDVVIGLEATFIYGDSLVYALREDGSLGRFQRKIHVLNPKQTHTRLNCQKTGSVGLSTAEGQQPVYPVGGLSVPFAALTNRPCFKICRGRAWVGVAFLRSAWCVCTVFLQNFLASPT